jgi:hypothetical protein
MKTALITGATGGIGYALAELFAKDNVNLILVARNEEHLKSMVTDFAHYPVNVAYYARDLSVLHNAMALYDELKAGKVRVDYLVNNAGFGICDEFISIDWQRELEMYQLNMITLAYFTKAFAKDMVQQGFGRILNVSSIASFQPGPYMAGYFATKAFILSLSEALHYELRGTPVKVSTLCPGVTLTRFHDVAQSYNTLMLRLMPVSTPGKVAAHGYRQMMQGLSLEIPGWTNRVLLFCNRILPRKLIIAFAALLLRKKEILNSSSVG